MDLLRDVFNHLALPPKVPGSQDPDVEAVSCDVLRRMIRACETIDAFVNSPWSEAFQSLQTSLESCLALHSGRLEKSTMHDHFRKLEPYHTLILHVAEQNASLLIRRETCDNEDRVVFEAFETSAPSERVIAAGPTLQWDFPGRCVQLPLDTFTAEPFQECLAAFLEQASMESLYSLQATAKKAAVSVTEIRDTTDPALITEMLIPLLEAMGSHVQVPILRKRVRDEVNIRDADLPWRRLPFWLVLRVAAQRQLCQILGNEQGRVGYKFLLCLLLAELLRESAGKLSPDLVVHLRAKLCRRMAKLETDRTLVEKTNPDVYVTLFDQICPVIRSSIQEATTRIEKAWISYKRSITRHIPKLPPRASDTALRLTLPNSGAYLDRLLENPPQRPRGISSLNLPQPLDTAIRKTQDFTDNIFQLAAMESRVRCDEQTHQHNDSGDEALCRQLAKQIDDVLAKVGSTYDSDPEQMSVMILTLFTLWVRLDKCAVAVCPLLGDHRPVFRSELLDVLQLHTMSDMRRLQDIQRYLAQRQSNCRYGTIFDKFSNECLASRYVAHSDRMRLLEIRIQTASDLARNAKEAEWEEECEEYDDLTAEISSGICCCSWSDGRRDVRGCTKCWQIRVRRRIQIQVHEAFLPEKNPARSVLLFELAIPSYLSAYRDATWKIYKLAYPSQAIASPPPEIKLTDCMPLKSYMTAKACGISLASSIKCFSQTHYKFNSGKISLSRVLLPLGADFQLYDYASKVWVTDFDKPLTFQHLCGIHIPRGLRTTVLPPVQHPLPTVDGPTSYEVQANQSECPYNMSPHEFSVYQKLLSGEARRWPNIIVELGSSSLNFNNEDTARLLCQLAVQAGPTLDEEVLRAAHVVFKEPVFTARLTEIIDKRLHGILMNWRESHSMDLIITLALRLLYFTSGASQDMAMDLLMTARAATLEWTDRLRKELRTATDADTAQRLALYGFCAALLCRRTFVIHAELDHAMGAEELAAWVRASIALQENLVVDLSKLPQYVRSLLLRDTKQAYHLQNLLKIAIQAYPASIGDGISRSWSDTPDGTVYTFSTWNLLSEPQDRWIVARVSGYREAFRNAQAVHFNIIEGHLLVDGKPRGKLPTEIRDSPAVKEMFGNQHLLTYPSSLWGMTHRLSTRVHGQEVHFGIRDGQVVIRTITKTRDLTEFIPPHVFISPKSFDLPAELRDNCIHWLNLNTKCLEIRRLPAVWIKRPSDWEVDVRERKASRRNVNLVDPQSDIFGQVAGILKHFERPEKLTVFQPLSGDGSLSVELRHMELSFFVNHTGLLQCRQLNAEIDPDQDAGTWYGLESKIVLRDIVSRERSIIVPLGGFKYNRSGMHIAVRTDGTHGYGKYRIDNILGRLSCPPEPHLLYTKAVCHAMTSFCLPDTLTGRTGTEEALTILRSRAAQPWIPLNDISHQILRVLERLPPQRQYYPDRIKRFQSVKWDESLTTTIQHDGFTSLVQDIVTKSNQLRKFTNEAESNFRFEDSTHLRRRGEMHRQLYQRPITDRTTESIPDKTYYPRDRKTSSKATNVYEIVRLLLTERPSLHMQTTIKSFLESNEVIGGFYNNPNPLVTQEPVISQIEDPISEKWGSLVQLCCYTRHTAPLCFRLGLLAFGPDPNMDIIRSLVGFFVLDELRHLPQPPYSSSFMDFKTRGRPSIELLETLITPACSEFEPIPRRRGEPRDKYGRSSQAHQALCEEEIEEFAIYVEAQWPSPADELDTGGFVSNFLNVPLALDKIHSEWERRRKNSELEVYVKKVQKIINSRRGIQDASALFQWTDAEPAFVGPKYSQIFPSDFLIKTGPLLDSPIPSISFGEGTLTRYPAGQPAPMKDIVSGASELEDILHNFASSTTARRQQYAEDLLQSLAVLKNAGQSNMDGPVPASQDVRNTMRSAYDTTKSYIDQISSALAAGDRRVGWLQLGTLWPYSTPLEVLALLKTASSYHYGAGMKEALVRYGLAIAHLQRLTRIHHALFSRGGQGLREELRNSGHENWSPVQWPDWLLLEIDGNFLIRAEQVEVAKAMITPSSGQNSVLQMNMGKGKTSCIVPMVIAALADGQNLARLIVPKALLMQTAQMMQSRLGGLVGREVFHVPFSRKTRSTTEMLELYSELHQKAYHRKGLILTSHEYVLSYRLGGWQHLADGKLEAAEIMTSFQHWLDDRCRDILDECDFTLAVKTQLNYPSGPEMAVDGHPFRWQIAQELLGLVAYLVPDLQKKFPTSIEVLERSGSYPIVHLLNSDVEDAIHNHILDSICTGRTSFLRPANTSFPLQQKTIKNVLSAKQFNEQKFAQAVNAFVNPQAASKILLVVRGLLVNRILLLCLNKRWNVQYGLHPGRHPVAVPFEAKGTPSEQSEFGHPDVAIIFTCLAFYYTGLSLKQFSQGLQNVLQSDDPAAQYESWISSCHSLPEALRQWHVINIEDAGQMEELCQHLRLNCNVINHYLNLFVFPVHAKQFEVKLQASAWDLPLYSVREQRGARTTGFSGTNDNRSMLPLTIRQDDLPSLQQTSAEVLSYLLQPRNRGYQVTVGDYGQRLSEKDLLWRLSKNGIRILIDAGAYILEMDNATLAHEWLGIDHEAKAAVYFDSDNRALVLYRGEKKEVPLLATPFADDLDGCVVYLDEAHTRGVDLKLPANAHGALTLALKQTKDFTMQAAMRLRQLGTTQTLTFFAPPEVDRSVRDYCCPRPNVRLDSSHVVSWLLEQTCCVNEDLQSLYVAQGVDYCRRADAIWRYTDFIEDTKHRTKLLDVLQQPEQQTLEQLYGGAPVGSWTSPVHLTSPPQLRSFVDTLTLSNGEPGVVQIGALEEVEQEREVQVQVEQVRQIQKPPKYTALTFPGLHPAILQLVHTGVLPRTQSGQEGAGFEHAFAYMGRTSIGMQYNIRETDSRLFVSTEFGRTISHGKRRLNEVDNYLRPVEWILWSLPTQTALVIIPEEAELLIPMLRQLAHKSLVCLIAYAAPVTKAMLCFNDFQYYTLPALPPKYEFPWWFRFELGILGGRLYVDSAEWDLLAHHLRLPSKGSTGPSKGNAVTESESESTDKVLPIAFADDPASFLLEWLTLLRRTQDVVQTPMGYICTGRTLRENHPFRGP